MTVTDDDDDDDDDDVNQRVSCRQKWHDLSCVNDSTNMLSVACLSLVGLYILRSVDEQTSCSFLCTGLKNKKEVEWRCRIECAESERASC